MLINVAISVIFRNRGWCYCGAIDDSGNGLVQIRNAQVRLPPRHGELSMAEQFGNVA